MLHAFLLLAVLVPGAVLSPARAQPRPFSCIGAERLEEDVFAIPFAKGASDPGEAARSNLAAAAELARREPGRNLCVLGHAGPQEGGAQAGIQLAARRAGQVAAALAKLGIERDRIRAEARRAAIAKDAVPMERSVTVVLLPPGPGAEPGPEPRAEPRPDPRPGPAPEPAAEPPARAPEKPAKP